MPPPITAARARMLYRSSLFGALLAGALVTLLGLHRSTLAGIGSLLAATAVLSVLISWLRLALENALALIRMADTLREIAEHEAVIAVNTTTPESDRRPRDSGSPGEEHGIL